MIKASYPNTFMPSLKKQTKCQTEGFKTLIYKQVIIVTVSVFYIQSLPKMTHCIIIMTIVLLL